MTSHTTTLFFLLVVAVVVASASPTRDPRSHELVGATREMERANYFTFVTLINMSPNLNIQSNVTFLMPNDRLLAGVSDLSPDSVAGFLLRHSIPSPLLFENLNLLPSGSVLPSSLSGYFLAVSNGGRSSYVVNNVKIISRNICSNSRSTVRCHGIDGVLSETSNYTAPACVASNVPSPSPSPSPSNYDYVGAAPSSQVPPVLPSPATRDSSDGGNKTVDVGVAPSPAASSGGGSFVNIVVVLVSITMGFVF